MCEAGRNCLGKVGAGHKVHVLGRACHGPDRGLTDCSKWLKCQLICICLEGANIANPCSIQSAAVQSAGSLFLRSTAAAQCKSLSSTLKSWSMILPLLVRPAQLERAAQEPPRQSAAAGPGACCLLCTGHSAASCTWRAAAGWISHYCAWPTTCPAPKLLESRPLARDSPGRSTAILVNWSCSL